MGQELDLLEREWEMERGKFYIFGRRGRKSLPSRSNIVIGLVFCFIFIAIGKSQMNMPDEHIVLIVSLFLISSIFSYFKVLKYESSLKRYEERRQNIIKKYSIR